MLSMTSSGSWVPMYALRYWERPSGDGTWPKWWRPSLKSRLPTSCRYLHVAELEVLEAAKQATSLQRRWESQLGVSTSGCSSVAPCCGRTATCYKAEWCPCPEVVFGFAEVRPAAWSNYPLSPTSAAPVNTCRVLFKLCSWYVGNSLPRQPHNSLAASRAEGAVFVEAAAGEELHDRLFEGCVCGGILPELGENILQFRELLVEACTRRRLCHSNVQGHTSNSAMGQLNCAAPSCKGQRRCELCRHSWGRW
jgi:hypothetical protein